MSVRERIRELERSREEILRKIEQCKKYKKDVEEIVQKTLKELTEREISRLEYHGKLDKLLKGKSAEEWISYYDDYVELCKKRLVIYGKEIRKEKRRRVKKGIGFVFVFFVIAIGLWFALSPQGLNITGLIVGEENVTEVDVTEEINVTNVTVPEVVLEVNVTEINVTNISVPEVPEEINVTEVNVTNVTVPEVVPEEVPVPEVPEKIPENVSVSTKQYRAVINRPVKWIKIVNVSDKEQLSNLSLEIPKEAENISVRSGGEVGEALREVEEYERVIERTDKSDLLEGRITGFVSSDIENSKGLLVRLWEWMMGLFRRFTITGSVIREEELEGKIVEDVDKKIVDLSEIAVKSQEMEYAVEYYLPGPEAVEEVIPNGKRVVVSSEVHYEEILAFSELDDVSENKIKLYRTTGGVREGVSFDAYDLNGNGGIDYIEWIVPSLSEETYEIIIEITKAEHLDSNKDFVEDVYDLVKARDDVWTDWIPDGHYLRVTFEQDLTSDRDITIYARSNDSGGVEVYEKDGSEKIADFGTISDDGKYKVYLDGLEGSQDVFDLKVVSGNVEFDYVVDPLGINTGNISNNSCTSTTCTISGHEIPAGSNRLLVVGASTSDKSKYPTGATYGGTGMIEIDLQNEVDGAEIAVAAYYMVNPPNGTADVVVSFSDAADSVVGAISFTGVDQSTPINGTISNNSQEGDPNLNVISDTGDLVMDVIATQASSISADGSQTERWNDIEGGSSKYGGASTEAGASPSVSMDWSVSNKWAAIGFNIVAAVEDEEAPQVDLNAPEEGYNSSSSTVEFNWTATDSVDTSLDCNLTIDSVVNASDVVSPNGTMVNYSVSGFADGNHLWNVTCRDDAGNSNTSETRSFYVETIDVVLLDGYGLNSSIGRVDEFNTSNLEEIEYMELNFSISTSGAVDSWYFNFTANGSGGCSLGNKQSSICYNYTNTGYKWIQFINDTDTVTYDGTQGNIGDRIIVTQTGSGGEINVTLRIDEHYNPNVFKWYDALYNYSDVKWQNGTDQRITGSNMIKVELNQSIIPLNADQYKLDFRVGYAGDPQQPLAAYFCNSSYVPGTHYSDPKCSLVAAKFPSQLQDVGTKFRGIFTRNLINGIGDVKYVLLASGEFNASNYYYIKSYKALAPSWVPRWEYTTDWGYNWSNLSDGYETELNINWFYDGADPTAFVYRFWANTTNWSDTYFEGNITWEVDPTNNYPPLALIIVPLSNQTIKLPYDVNFSLSDPNDDNLNASLYLYQGGTLNKTLVTGMNQSNQSYYWSNSQPDGAYDLILQACELGTSDLFCFNDTHGIILDSTPPTITVYSPLNQSYVNATILINFTAADSGAGVDTTWYYNESDNVTYTSEVYEDVSDGSHTFIFYANDTLGNENETSVTFSVDTTPPAIDLNAPEDGYNTSSITVEFNWTATANIDTSLDCNLTIDSVVNASDVASPNGTMVNYSVSGFADGEHLWNVTCWDDGSNTNTSETRSFTVETVAPTISVVSPLNQSRFNVSDVEFNVSLNEEGSWCGFSLDGAANVTMTAFNVTYFNYTNTSTTEGWHNISFSCNDTLGNMGVEEGYAFLVDTVYPLINYESPTADGGTNQSNTDIYVNYTISDANDAYSFVDFDESLVGWWRFENANTTWTEDESGEGNDGSVINATETDAGRFGSAYEFDGDDDYIKRNVTDWQISDSQGTISAWIKRDATGANHVIFSSADEASLTRVFYFYADSNNYIRILQRNDDSLDSVRGNTNISSDTWYHVILASNETDWSLYVNGVAETLSTVYGSNSGDWFADVDSRDNIIIGALEYGAGVTIGFNGTIDEVTIWNRSLSTEEIVALYNSTRTYHNFTNLSDGRHTFTAYVVDEGGNKNETEERSVTIDTTKPNVELNAPEDYANTSSTVEFNWTATDNIDISLDCNLTIDSVVNASGVSSPNGTMVNYSVSGFADGAHLWNVTCWDDVGNSNTSETRSFTVSINAAPTITDISDVPTQSVTEGGVSYVTFNVLASDANGVGDLNDSSINATFSKVGEEVRTNSSCSLAGDLNTTTANYSCSIGIWYWDGAGTWNVSASILDNQGAGSAYYNESFVIQEDTCMVMSPGYMDWATLYPGDLDELSTANPIAINNTCNDDIDTGNVRVNAINLLGEQESSDFIPAANFTTNTANACEGTALVNGTATGVSGSVLSAGNNSLGFGNETSGQEELYVCLEHVPDDISSQPYSTALGGDWEISILLAVFAVGGRKKKKKKKRKSKKREEVSEIFERILKRRFKIDAEELLALDERMRERYGEGVGELLSVVREKKVRKEIMVPVDVFRQEMGAAEALCKYLGENKKMRFSEIARLLNRDQRSVWTSYSAAVKKKKARIRVSKKVISVPVEIFSDRRLSILESIVFYLREKGFRNSEVAEILGRDQRNVWTLYSRAVKKLGSKR